MSATIATRDIASQINPAAFATCLEDLQGLIKYTCAKFCRFYKTDIEDAESYGSIGAFRAYCNWQGGTATSDTFEQEVRRVIWHNLYDHYRTVAGIRRSSGAHEIAYGGTDLTPVELAASKATGWAAQEWLEELSKDAAIVAALVLDTPAELARVAEAKGGSPRNLRSTIREHLQGLGWCAARINESFEEIKAAL